MDVKYVNTKWYEKRFKPLLVLKVLGSLDKKEFFRRLDWMVKNRDQRNEQELAVPRTGTKLFILNRGKDSLIEWIGNFKKESLR